MVVINHNVGKGACEYAYINNVLFHLRELLPSDDYKLIFSCVSPEAPHKGDDVEFDSSKKNIVIAISDEWSGAPSKKYIDNAFLIFKCYVTKDILEKYDNVYPFPLGYNQKFKAISPVVPIDKRNLDIFFAGHCFGGSRRQQEMKPVLKMLGLGEESNLEIKDTGIRSAVTRTKGFNSGYEGNEYSKLMCQSKIALCPHGNVSSESFRYYEAAKAGCVIISPPLPQHDLYTNTGAIQLSNWVEDIEYTIKDLLSNERKLKKLHQKTLNDWANRYSEKSAAEYIYSKVKKLSIS